LPATACILQDRLGLSNSCLAFDICLGCSGYIYGLAVAASMVSAMRLPKVLLLVGENTLMQHTPENISAYPLFGDAGTATALSYDPSAPDIYANLRTDGSGYKSIIVERGGVRSPIRPKDDSFDFFPLDGGGRMRPCDCLVDGAAIMDFCLREVKPCVEELLAFAEIGIDSIDAVYAHQAYLLINETVRKMCKIPAEKHPYNIEEFGNTSCASIPLLMSTRGAAELSGGARRNLLLGFGVGLSWGGIIADTDKISCPPLVEI